MEAALQSSVYVTSPEFAGWLQKRGFRWRKLWRRRWVALHGAEIVYMEPTVENNASLTITKAQITTSTLIAEDPLDPCGFTIQAEGGSVWHLRAESVRGRKSWMVRLAHVHMIVRWLEEFEKVRVLGVGGTGIVYELLHKRDGQRCAMKEMEIRNKTQMKLAVSEAEMLKDIMENVPHPNILHMERVFQVGSKFYLVFPLCVGGELYEHIIRRGHFTEHDAAVITRDLVSGLHALHCHDILHLDVKPENILFDSGDSSARIKITDFGLSK
ncbi:kinase-like domain-containing protein, partial [Ochromonadaceae sp. CCMP2298]